MAAVIKSLATYRCDGLHAQHKGVRGQVSRVRQAVFFPQLSKEVLPASHAGVVVAEIALKEEVNETTFPTSAFVLPQCTLVVFLFSMSLTQAEPERNHFIHIFQAGRHDRSEEPCCREDDRAASCEGSKQLLNGQVVEDEAGNLDIHGVIGMTRLRNFDRCGRRRKGRLRPYQVREEIHAGMGEST